MARWTLDVQSMIVERFAIHTGSSRLDPCQLALSPVPSTAIAAAVQAQISPRCHGTVWSGLDTQAGKFTGSGLATTSWRLPPLALMTQSLSLWTRTSKQPTRNLRPAGDHTSLKARTAYQNVECRLACLA